MLVGVLSRQIVAWDIHAEPDIAAWLYRTGLVAILVIAIVIAAKCWYFVGLHSKQPKRILGEVVALASEGSFSKIPETLRKLPPRGPEAGLRELISTSPTSDQEIFLHVVERAHANFVYVMSRIEVSVRRLRILLALVLMGSLMFMLNNLSALYGYVAVRTISLDHIHSTVVQVGYASAILYYGVWVILALYLLYCHLMERLRRRRIVWEYFYSRIRLLES